jgi:hypothetical protein
MHIGAALGLPVVALFGDSDPVCWHPWLVNHTVLPPASRNVTSLSSSEVYDAFLQTIIQSVSSRLCETSQTRWVDCGIQSLSSPLVGCKVVECCSCSHQ